MTAGDCYTILDISRSATAGEIRSAYRKLVRQFHPDATNNDPLLTKRFMEVQRAFEILSDLRERPDQFRFHVKVDVSVSSPRSRPPRSSNAASYHSTAGAPHYVKKTAEELAVESAAKFGIPRAEAELLIARIKQIDPDVPAERLLQFMLRFRNQPDAAGQMALAGKVFCFIKSHKEGVSLATIRREFEELVDSRGIIGFHEAFGHKIRTRGFKADMFYFVV
jgi:curved DNA-binding protein CbpA